MRFNEMILAALMFVAAGFFLMVLPTNDPKLTNMMITFYWCGAICLGIIDIFMEWMHRDEEDDDT